MDEFQIYDQSRIGKSLIYALYSIQYYRISFRALQA
jgi:hypothetical protein